MSSFSIEDIRFRRIGDDECSILVHGDEVGTLSRRPDVAHDDPGRVYFVAHLWDDARGPRHIDDRGAIRRTIVTMLIERDLVPPAPPPVHPDFAGRRHRLA